MAKIKSARKGKAKLPEPFEHYRPELADWESAHMTRLAPRKFEIRDCVRGGRKPSIIGTIEISDAVSEGSALAIAQLIIHAPNLWRMLRQVTPHLESEDPSMLGMFHEACVMLMTAAGRNAFLPRLETDDDDAIYIRRMKQAGFVALTEPMLEDGEVSA